MTSPTVWYTLYYRCVFTPPPTGWSKPATHLVWLLQRWICTQTCSTSPTLYQNWAS